MRGPRVVKSRDEFEGEIYETTTLVEGRDLPAALDGQFAVLGKAHPRVDGRPRVTGRAIYTQDVVLRGEKTIFREEVRFVGDDVAAVAADDADTAARALALIDFDYELLPHVTDLEEAIGEGAPKLDPDGNVHDAGSFKRGDVRKAFREAETTVEATYRTSTALH